MITLTEHKVVARVRTEGAIGVFEPRDFFLMLDLQDDMQVKEREAIRILRQIGYETCGLRVIEGEAP